MGESLKKFLRNVLVSLAVACSITNADQIMSGQFDYLNNNEAPAIIPATQAQDLLNVDITPNGLSVKKRSGYGIYKTLSTSQAIHGAHHFFDTAGSDIQVWGSSTSLYGIVSDATPTQLVSSATLSTTWDCADSQGFAYCVNSSRNALIKTNGATITWFTSPLGTMVAVTPDRLLISGVSGTANTIYFSESGNLTNFVTAGNATSPFTEVISAPGSRITHVEYGCGRVLWWKDQSFGYILGSDQTDVQIVTVSNQIGTTDNSSATDPNGNIYFRSQEGHFYRYDCSNIEKLSVDITPNVQVSGQRTSNSWTQTTTSDFQAGASSNTMAMDNAVYISTNSANINENGFETFTINTYWFRTGVNFFSQTANTTATNCGIINARTGSYAASWGSATDSAWTLTAALVDSSSTTLLSTTAAFADSACSYTQRTITGSTTHAKKRVRLKFTTSLDATVSLSSEWFIYNGDNISFYTASDSNGPTNNVMMIDDITSGKSSITSGYFSSAVKNAPSLTTWDTFSAGYQAYSETIAFFMRSSTNSFTVSSSTPTWQSVTSGGVVSISTGTYFQVRSSFVFSGVGTQTPQLDDFTVNWFEGSAGDKAYATYFGDAIWWSVTFGDGQTTNNYIFKYDLLHPGWTLYNFGTGGFLTQSNRLYFGDTSSDGRLFRYGNATSDNGTSINAYWKSKDFSGQDPWLENEYMQIDTFARRNTGQSITATYTLNASTTTTSFNISLSNTTDGNIRWKKLLPAGKIGGLFNIKYSDDSSTSSWELLGFRVVYKALPYRPSQ